MIDCRHEDVGSIPRRTARAEGGVTWGEFDHETQAFGLATTGGSPDWHRRPHPGWRYRLAAGKYGLACDNLISVDIVTADGQLADRQRQRARGPLLGCAGRGRELWRGHVLRVPAPSRRPGAGGVVFYPFAKPKSS